MQSARDLHAVHWEERRVRTSMSASFLRHLVWAQPGEPVFSNYKKKKRKCENTFAFKVAGQNETASKLQFLSELLQES